MNNPDDYERDRMQIRNALYGVSTEEKMAAQVQGEVAANVDDFADSVALHILAVDGLYEAMWEKVSAAHQQIRERAKEAALHLGTAEVELKDVMTSRAGNEILADIETHRARMRSQYLAWNNEVIKFVDILTAVHALKEVLRAKARQADTVATNAGSLQVRLQNASAENRRVADDL